MAVSYNRLFELLSQKGISKTELQKKIGMSSTTIAKLAKNENVSLKIIEDICSVLNCQPGDIIEVNNRRKNLLLDFLCIEKEMNRKDGLYGLTQISMASILPLNFSKELIREMFLNHTISVKADETFVLEEIQSVQYLFRCFDYVLNVAEKTIDERMIREIYSILCMGTERYYAAADETIYRQKEAEINVDDGMGNKNIYTYCSPHNIHSELVRCIALYNQKVFPDLGDVVKLFAELERIQPFEHLNWMIGALLVYKECLKNQIMPFLMDERFQVFAIASEIYSSNLERIFVLCEMGQKEYKESVDAYMEYYGIKNL